MKRPQIYTRPNKPLFVPVPKRDWHEKVEVAPVPDLVTVYAGTECHITPQGVAERMAEMLDLVEGCSILEPSAGTGNLARAVLNAGAKSEQLTLVEMHCRLASGLAGLGTVENVDFLEWAAEMRGTREFQRIIMNPPFSRVRAHVSAAVSLLAKGGRIVALVPITFARENFEIEETLSSDVFAHAKVHTKIVSFEANE